MLAASSSRAANRGRFPHHLLVHGHSVPRASAQGGDRAVAIYAVAVSAARRAERVARRPDPARPADVPRARTSGTRTRTASSTSRTRSSCSSRRSCRPRPPTCGVNKVTPTLFAKYPTAADYAGADRDGAGDDHPADRLLPGQDRLAHQARRRPRRALRRRGAAAAEGPGHAARASGARPRTSCSATPSTSRHHRRHALRPARAPLRLDRGGGPGQGRARGRRPVPAQGLDDAQPRRDLPRPPHLPRQEARLRRLPRRPLVPVATAIGETDPDKAAKLLKFELARRPCRRRPCRRRHRPQRARPAWLRPAAERPGRTPTPSTSPGSSRRRRAGGSRPSSCCSAPAD